MNENDIQKLNAILENAKVEAINGESNASFNLLFNYTVHRFFNISK